MNKAYYHNPNYLDRRHNSYALVIYLPEHLEKILKPLREKFDPDYNLVDSHITITFPFDSEMPIDEITAIVQSEVNKYDPFELELGSIGDFYPKTPIIFWNVLKKDILLDFYLSINKKLGQETIKDYQPHVTIAREISNHRLMLVKDQIASYLSCDSIYVDTVDLIAPLSDRKWVSVRTFKLEE